MASIVMVETSMAGNLGAALRVAANFGVPRVDLVRPAVDPHHEEVQRWACGAERHLDVRRWRTFAEAVAGYRTLAATASGRGRDNLPAVTPREAVERLTARGLDTTAVVFGNETSGLGRHHLDRCDFVIRIPTSAAFPVLNLTQAIAILLGYLCIEVEPRERTAPAPAPTTQVDGLMDHLESALADIGFTDPDNPERILRKLRRLFGRAGVTSNEVKIVRGICRQMQWAARTDPRIVVKARGPAHPPGDDE
jgi:TrmH family RNA methyltransferase